MLVHIGEKNVDCVGYPLVSICIDSYRRPGTGIILISTPTHSVYFFGFEENEAHNTRQILIAIDTSAVTITTLSRHLLQFLNS